MKTARLLLSAAIITASLTASPAQEKSHDSHLTIDYLRGPVYDHRKLAGVLDLGMTQGIGLEYLRKVDGGEPWHHHYRSPKLGFAAYYEDFKYPEVLGKAFSAALVSDFHIVDRRFFDFDLNIQAGCAYLTKKFDAKSNNLNLFIGSRLSAFFRFGFEIVAMPESRVSWVLGANFVHYSNGAVKMPNLGLNLCQWNVGARLRLNEQPATMKGLDTGEPQTDFPLKYQAIVSFGIRERGTPEGDKYMVTVLSGNSLKKLTRKFVAGAGIDIFRDGSDNSGDDDEEDGGVFSGGVHVSGGLEFGRAYAALEIGGYMFGKSHDFMSMYDRVSVNYEVNKRLVAHVGLKTFLMKAQFIEWGVGYQMCK